MSKITEYEAASAFDANDVLLKDGDNGTMIISVEDAASEFKRLGGIDDDISGINQSVTQAMGTIASNIAGVETDYIASKDYAIGDLFIVNNVLYKATAAIAEEAVIDTEINCAVVNLGDEIGDIHSELANKANVDGSYSTLTAGNAEQLVGTVFTEDDAAYTFRTSGGSADIGDREYDEIVGGSIVWNQLQANTVSKESNGITFTYDNGALTISGTAINNAFWLTSTDNKWMARNGHVYLVDVGNDDYIGSSSTYNWYFTSTAQYNVLAPTRIFKYETADALSYLQVIIKSGAEIDSTFKPQVFDLTQMFGSEIADYIYNLEQTTPGAGVAWFRKYFPKDYYEYNAGELMHVSDLQSHDMVGFNQEPAEAHVGWFWSNTGAPSKTTSGYEHYASSLSKIKCLPNTTYCFSAPNRLSAKPLTVYPVWFDDEGTYYGRSPIGKAMTNDVTKVTFTTDGNARYFSWYLYRNKDVHGHITEDELNDICINLSWDGERDGEYEPYVKHSYPLDSSLTLRGIPKLSTDGKLYYDGDHYKSDGTVERRYGIVDLGTLEWNYDPATETKPIQRFQSTGLTSLIKRPTNANEYATGLICSQFVADRDPIYTRSVDRAISKHSSGSIYITDSSYTDAESFKAAMSGVYLVYELEEPTTETATAYQSPQIVDDFGTEEYVTSSIVPVGHITQYDSNLRAKLEMAPNSPDGDGDYLVRQTGGQNEYVPYTDSGRITALEGKIPTPPSTDGAYVLKCTVADGTPTYSWVAE